MKVDDVLFELRANYVDEDDIITIEEFVKKNGINLKKIDIILEDMGYEAIFDDYEAENYSNSEKIQHKKHLSD